MIDFSAAILSLVCQTGIVGQAERAGEEPIQVSSGPAKGSLVIQGGGDILPEIWERFVELAGVVAGIDGIVITMSGNGRNQ